MSNYPIFRVELLSCASYHRRRKEAILGSHLNLEPEFFPMVLTNLIMSKTEVVQETCFAVLFEEG